jgi:CubicO group peptidase (beta-lactamase class C family)
MTKYRFSTSFSVFLIVTALAADPCAASAQGDIEARVDAIFERWAGTATPGCSVAASREGKTVLAKAYGMTDLERDVRNNPDTIFEAGSVSKQFTAAAVLLLAREIESNGLAGWTSMV